MRLLGLLIAGLVLARSASAQTVKPTDLLGQWVRQGGQGQVGYTFRADSTFKLAGVGVAGEDEKLSVDAVGRWRLAGDTLLFSQVELQVEGQTVEGDGAEAFAGDLIRLVKLSGRMLTTTSRDGKIQRVYERRDVVKP